MYVSSYYAHVNFFQMPESHIAHSGILFPCASFQYASSDCSSQLPNGHILCMGVYCPHALTLNVSSDHIPVLLDIHKDNRQIPSPYVSTVCGRQDYVSK